MSYLNIARRVLNEKTREGEKRTKETKKVVAVPATIPTKLPPGLREAAMDVGHAALPSLMPAGAPIEWAAGLARLWRMPIPGCIRPNRRWRQILVDAHRVVDGWGEQATALGWTALNVFGAHPTHPVERLDCAGLVLLLHGDELAELTADAGRIRTRSGALLTYYRRRLLTTVPLWELAVE